MTQHEFDLKLHKNIEWNRLSENTKQIYLAWLRRFCTYYRNHQSDSTPRKKILSFLMAVYPKAAPPTTRQAIAALSWFYTHIHGTPISSDIRIKKPYRLPERFFREDIERELRKLPVLYEFMGYLFAGAGLLLHEAVSLRHEQIIRNHEEHGEFLVTNIGKTIDIPLHREACRIYAAIKKQRGYIFPKTNTMFGRMCKKYGVDRRMTPGALRANFILLALEKNGVAWTQAATGLSAVRMQEYYKMLPVWGR